MSYLRNGLSSFIVGIVMLVLLCTLANPSFGVTPVPFVTNPPTGGPVGFTYAGNKFVGSVLGDGTGRLYSTDFSGGSVTPFAPTVNLAASFGFEHYVSSSWGLGGFPLGDVFVGAGNNIVHISNNGLINYGSVVGSTTPLTGDVRGITFDLTGNWNYDMLVTTHDGYVYRINSTGNATQIAYTGTDTEGLDVAPLGTYWGGLAGSLFVACEGPGTIYAIKPANTPALPGIQVVTGLSGAEQLTFVPLALTYATLEGLYSANYSYNVLKAPSSDFTSFLGDAIVTSESGYTGSIWTISPSGTSGPFLNDGLFPSPNQPEDGIFVTAQMITLSGGDVPEPASLSLLALGAIVLLRRRRA